MTDMPTTHEGQIPSGSLFSKPMRVEQATHALLTGLSGAGGVWACGALNEAMSLEQLVIDSEIAGMVRRELRGLDVTDETMALERIEAVGIGGNCLE